MPYVLFVPFVAATVKSDSYYRSGAPIKFQIMRIISSILFVFILTGAALAQQAQDRGWPRGYTLPSDAQIVLFQPQIASWQDQKHAVALAAVSYVAKGAEKPVIGTIKIETDTEVSLEQRLVKFSTLKITEANFQS